MGFTTLVYHEIREPEDLPQTVSPIVVGTGYEDMLPARLFLSIEDFEKQMRYLKEQNYHFLEAREIRSYLNGQSELPDQSVFVTFDDCYQSMKVYAYEILKKYGIKATAFVVGDWLLSKPLSFDPKRSVTLAEADLLSMRDVFQYANHTKNGHWRPAFTVSAFMEQDLEAMRQDVLGNVEFLDEPKVLAYPFGFYRPENLPLLQSIGMELAFTASGGLNTSTTPSLELRRDIVPQAFPFHEFIALVERKETL